MNELSNQRQQIRHAFARASKSYDAAAVLQREVLQRLLERLVELNLQPEQILDIGTGTGSGIRALRNTYRRATLIGLDFALPMLRQLRSNSGIWRKPIAVCADAHSLPFRDNSFDLVFSSLTFQWCDELPKALAESRRVLADNGVLLFATLGPDTLSELRSAWAEVDETPHVNMFTDMHIIGDALLQAGFKNPVVDVERIVLSYASVKQLLLEIKALGANTVVAPTRKTGLMGKRRFQKMQQAYQQFELENGHYPASFEIIFGLAWQSENQTEPGAAPISFVPPDELPK